MTSGSRAASSGRSLAARLVPSGLRRFLRTAISEIPTRIRDLPADAREAAARAPHALPPPRLRRRVAGSSGRRDFLRIGHAASDDIRRAVDRCGVETSGLSKWLDFGCGAGRVARHVAVWPFVSELWGADVDPEAIDWARGHMSGRWEVLDRRPPSALPAGHFDAAYAISVFTHLDRDAEGEWLAEIHRVLKPGGFFIASTHAPSLSWGRPDMTDAERDRLLRDGFLFLAGTGRDFNDDTAFHDNAYLRRTWGRLFGQLAYLGHGVAGFQDLTVWKKWE